MRKVPIFFLFLIIILTGPHLYTEWKHDRQISLNIDSALEDLDIYQNQPREQAGHVQVEGVKEFFSEKTLHRLLKDEKRYNINKPYIWQWYDVKNATLSAQGLDRHHHFSNSYLVGYKPFDTKSVWVPLYTLTIRKKYEFDHVQYSGIADVWQNSRQAFYYTRGDCEDHALILTDWLISMGMDARVVTGKFKGNGHAWVVLLKDGKEYLLEATNKKKLNSLNSYLLAGMASGYQPEFQFNREHFWFNAGKTFTSSYSGDHWILKSRYVH